MADGHDEDGMRGLVDAIPDPVFAPAGHPVADERFTQRLADPARIVGQRTDQQFATGGRGGPGGDEVGMDAPRRPAR